MTTTAVDTTQRIEIAVQAGPEQVWNALIDGDVTPAYYLGFRAEFGDLAPGSPYRYTAGGATMIFGRILAVEEGRALTMTFNGRWDVPTSDLPESTVTFRLFDPFMPMPGVTFLSCRHEGLPDTDAARHLRIGWVTILSGLKTLVETGAPLSSGPAH